MLTAFIIPVFSNGSVFTTLRTETAEFTLEAARDALALSAYALNFARISGDRKLPTVKIAIPSAPLFNVNPSQ